MDKRKDLGSLIIEDGDISATQAEIEEFYKGECEVCMGELLADTTCPNLTLEECFLLYCGLMTWAEGDVFIQVKDDTEAIVIK